MTDTNNSSPTKYDGYSAYLSTIPRESTFPVSASSNQETGTSPSKAPVPQPIINKKVDVSSDGSPSKDVLTPQKSSQRIEKSSPPFTPSTPPPPPPVPKGGLPPLNQPSGSFADAVRPLGRPTSPDNIDGGNHVVDDPSHHGDGEFYRFATAYLCYLVIYRNLWFIYTHIILLFFLELATSDTTRETDTPEERDNTDNNACKVIQSPAEDENQDDASSKASSPIEWEDFMLHYWNLPTPETSSPNPNAPSLQIHAHAQDIVLAEDTDLKPCPMEPVLDEEPYLSPIRTGCIDIDMEMRASSTDELDDNQVTSPLKELSNAGLECSRIMAKLHGGEIPQNAVSIATPHKKRQSPAKHERNQSLDLQSLNSFDEKRSVTSNANTANSIENIQNLSPTEEWPNKISPLPSKNLIHSFGPIQTRISLRSLVMKKWNPSQWMHYGPHTLLLFKNKEQMDDWRYNPYHAKKARDHLVKQRIDFYSEMVMGEKEGKSGSVLGHRILPIKRKSYGKNETEM